MIKFKTLEHLIAGVLETRPPFFKGDIIVKCNKSTMCEIDTAIEEYMSKGKEYDSNNKITKVNINGIVVEFEEDTTAPDYVMTYKFIEKDD